MEEPLSQKHTSFVRPLVLGIFLGLLVAFCLWFVQNYRSKNDNPPVFVQKKLSLNLKTPVTHFATSEKTLSISGSAGMKSVVTVSTFTQNKIIDTSTGTFSALMDLVEGKNVIKITAFDPVTGNSVSETREVFYLNEDLSNL